MIDYKEQTVIFTHGLPGSGKSTWAKAEVENHTSVKRLSRDDFRTMLDGYSYDRELEKVITDMLNNSLVALLKAGYSVIIDNTNLRPSYVRDLARIAKGVNPDIVFHIKTFEDVPFDVILERNKKRGDFIPDEILFKMRDTIMENRSSAILAAAKSEPADKHNFVGYVANPDKTKAIIVDIDGTIAHKSDRDPHYFSRVHEDSPDESIRDLVNRFIRDTEILYVSGRSSACRYETETWIKNNRFPSGKLFMREDGDRRPDYIIKYELFDNYIRNNYNVLFVLDDRNSVVDMWRKIGLKCLQVAGGDF